MRKGKGGGGISGNYLKVFLKKCTLRKGVACDTFPSTNETDVGFRWSYGGLPLSFSRTFLLLPTELYGKHRHIELVSVEWGG